MESSDAELARRARGGDLEAYGQLVGLHQAAVYNVWLRLLGEAREAEDLAQDAFIRAHGRLDLFDPTRPFGPWIRRLAANLCLNRLEEMRRLELPLDADQVELRAGADPTPEQALSVSERSEALRSAILSLPPAYRAVIELRHFEEMSYDEIARHLHIPLSDVKSHLFRARQLLASRLMRYE